jgi:hypothetical protein
MNTSGIVDAEEIEQVVPNEPLEYPTISYLEIHAVVQGE